MRTLNRYRYVAAGLLTLVIFVTGALTSNLVDDFRSDKLQTELQEDLIELESSQMQLEYLSRDDVSCETMRTGLRSTVRDYNSRLSRVQTFRDRSLFKSQRFDTIRQRYVLSGIRYWIFAQQMKQKCNYSPHTVLFFTSNLEADDCDDCERVGRQLSLLKREMDGNLLVFSVPVQLEDGMVEVLKNRYNASDPPKLVIDGNRTMEGYHSRQEIRRALE